MQLWLSAEAQVDISDALRQAQLRVTDVINPRLTADFGADIEEWALIFILRPKIPDGWGEVYQYHRGRRVAEFRLIVDYESFKIASADKQVLMLLQSILRSFDLFPHLKVTNFDIRHLRRDFIDAALAAGWSVL